MLFRQFQRARFFFAFSPRIVHQYSIVSPSILHRNDGPSMEYRWRIDGVYSDKKRKKRVREEQQERKVRERTAKKPRYKIENN